MARQIIRKLRDSASLIILAKDKLAAASNSFDYKVLMFKRAAKSSFMANFAAFPGGVYERMDESPLWLEHFRNFDLSLERLQQLVHTDRSRTGIFTKHHEEGLEKEIALRITAIRETFEEMGILLCRRRRRSAMNNEEDYGQFFEDFDRLHWQHEVHNDHTKFLSLCRELDVVPDLWSLHEWSLWVTPSQFDKRFKTVFYLVALEHVPAVLPEPHEVAEFMWKTPFEFLQMRASKKIDLPPPQLYELSRFLNYSSMNDLKDFARRRAVASGLTPFLPVHYKCVNGFVGVLPGDDMYPTEALACTRTKQINVTVEQSREQVKHFHRFEGADTEFTIRINIKPLDNHLEPVDFDHLCRSM